MEKIEQLRRGVHARWHS